MRAVFFILAAFCVSQWAAAQPDRLNMPGIGMNRYGFAFNYKYQKADNPNSVWTRGDLFFEMGNIVNPREIALINNSLQNSGIYKFGKINYAWTLRNYYMVRRNISQRQDRKNVAMNAIFGAGIPFCYTWPVYIRYFDPGAGPNGSTDVVRYDPEIHQQAQIAGRASFSTGIKEGKVIPGVGLNAALEFFWGNYRSDVKVLTLGTRIEGYNQNIPILYRSDLNKRLFSMFYFNFAFGFGKN